MNELEIKLATRAAELIETGWCQCSLIVVDMLGTKMYYHSVHSREAKQLLALANQVCAVGAVYKAAVEFDVEYPISNNSVGKCITQFENQVHDGIATYNDKPTRTAEEVAKQWRIVAEYFSSLSTQENADEGKAEMVD